MQIVAMKLMSGVVIFVLLGLIMAEAVVEGRRRILFSKDMGELIERINQAVDQPDAISFENDDDDLSEIRQIIEEAGYDSDAILNDYDFLSGISALFSKGDGRRWATLNFVYQLACYQGRGGQLYRKALWVWKTYNRYGCYCGSGEYHGNYLDATDHCCKIHDACYVRVQAKYQLKTGCHTYTTPYHVSCCKEDKITKCTDAGPSAGRELCECDQAMSKCVAQHKAKSTYNEHLYQNRSQCKGKANGHKETTGVMELIKSCKHINEPRKTFPLTYGSQGSCPKQTKSKRRCASRRRRRRRWF